MPLCGSGGLVCSSYLLIRRAQRARCQAETPPIVLSKIPEPTLNNAAHQASFEEIEDISDAEWELTFKVNIHAMFYLTKAAVPHMKPGSCIINTASINSDAPNPTLLAYATTKGAIQHFPA